MIFKNLKQLEKTSGKHFGDATNPLLLSVRSGTAISMPGAMDTFLNVGLNDELVEAISQNPEMSWSIWDSYRRLIQSWGMAHGIDRDVFDSVISGFKQKHKVRQKLEFDPSDMRQIAYAYKEVLKSNKIRFEENLFDQLIQTIDMVFASWSSERAFAYRRHLQISDNWGTAVIVQKNDLWKPERQIRNRRSLYSESAPRAAWRAFIRRLFDAFTGRRYCSRPCKTRTC